MTELKLEAVPSPSGPGFFLVLPQAQEPVGMHGAAWKRPGRRVGGLLWEGEAMGTLLVGPQDGGSHRPGS